MRCCYCIVLALVASQATYAATLNVTTVTNGTPITIVEAEQNYDVGGQGPSDPIAQGLNTVPYDGVDRQITFDGETGWISNDMWGGRGSWTGGGILDDGIWHSDHNDGHGNNAPMITTSINVPLGDYGVYVAFVASDAETLSPGHGGMIMARLHDPSDTATLTTYGAEGNTLDLAQGENTKVATANDQWTIQVAWLGDVANTDTLSIDVDNDPRIIGAAARNLYVGIGYGATVIPEPSSILLLGLGLVGLVLGVRRRYR